MTWPHSLTPLQAMLRGKTSLLHSSPSNIRTFSEFLNLPKDLWGCRYTPQNVVYTKATQNLGCTNPKCKISCLLPHRVGVEQVGAIFKLQESQYIAGKQLFH